MSASTTGSPPADSDVLVKVENVGKVFCRSLKKSLYYGLHDSLRDLNPFAKRDKDMLRQLRRDEFWANKGVSFELHRGECLALIGHNGAGKTTLLKMLNGLIKPDAGRIEMHGRVGALIALGAGFNPILTGRENIYVNAPVLGISKEEIDEKIDDIIDFAEVRDFIDSPVQNYSSGMQVRLGFAIATAFNPDILILDEVLAVGDVSFRAKCYTRIGEIMHNAAVIVVSHDANTLGQICDYGIVLEHGSVVGGEALPIFDALQKYQEIDPVVSDPTRNAKPAHLSSPAIQATACLEKNEIDAHESLELTFSVDLKEPLSEAVFRATVFSMNNEAVIEWNSLAQRETVNLHAGANKLRLSFGPMNLRAGQYELSVLLADKTGLKMVFLWHRGVPFTAKGVVQGQAPVQLAGLLRISSSQLT